MEDQDVINNEKLFHTGDEFYEHVFNDIRSAEQSIHVEIHLMDDGKLGRKFSTEIFKALDRGIQVFAIADGFTFTSNRLKRWVGIFQRKGGRISYFNPLPWRSPSLRGLLKLNQRNHKKVILIDGKIAYLGSYNIDTRQMSREFGGQGWHDIGVRVTGEVVNDIFKGFYDSWNYCFNYQRVLYKHEYTAHSIRLNHRDDLRKKYFRDIIRKIDNANRRIWITNPYFVPDDKMIAAIKGAHKRGVDIRIIIPQKSDLKLFPLINSLYYRDLVKSGVKVYEYKLSILHAKMMIIDEWMMIGSSNLNSRTQKHDWEIDVVLKQPSTKNELVARFLGDLRSSQKITYRYVVNKFNDKQITIPFLKAIRYFL